MTSKPNPFTKIKSYRLWTSRKEFPITLFALSWIILCVFLMSLANVYVDRLNIFLNTEIEDRFRVPDPLLDLLYPYYVYLNLPETLPDTLVTLSVPIMLSRVIVGGQYGLLIFRRIVYIIGVGYLMRIPFILMTILPTPLLTCTTDPNPNILIYTMEVMIQLKSTCGDVVFSGHTIIFMSTSLVWMENPLPNLTSSHFKLLLNTLIILFSTVGIFSLVASSFHYTLDCTISILAMLFLWKFYHFVIRTNYYDDHPIGNLIMWADGNKYVDDLMSTESPMVDLSVH